jgi:fluoroacetyl-CoA thioesterase
MLPDMDGREIHPVYGTFWLAYHTEVVSRRVLEPFLEPGEEGVGVSVSVRHIGMAAVGETIHFEAVVAAVNGRRILCTITAKTPRALIAEGTQEQAVLPAEVLKARVAEVYAAHTDAKT